MAEVSGRVARVYHDMGDIVKPGDLLLELDSTDYDLEVAEKHGAPWRPRSFGWGYISRSRDISPEEGLVMFAEAICREKLPSVMRAIQQEDNARQKSERAGAGTPRHGEFDQYRGIAAAADGLRGGVE